MPHVIQSLKRALRAAEQRHNTFLFLLGTWAERVYATRHTEPLQSLNRALTEPQQSLNRALTEPQQSLNRASTEP
jgi:hypothetical protein